MGSDPRRPWPSLSSIGATIALQRVWQRPSTERLFAGLVLAMPVTGYLASISHRLLADERPLAVTVARSCFRAAAFSGAIAFSSFRRLVDRLRGHRAAQSRQFIN